MQVKPKIGLTFANGLRHIVRQDPDIIMIGEIRDKETAEIAIHLRSQGISYSAPCTQTMLRRNNKASDMGIESFWYFSSTGVLAQRLVRVICPKCKKPLSDKERLKEIDK